jgi:hypothetical protein
MKNRYGIINRAFLYTFFILIICCIGVRSTNECEVSGLMCLLGIYHRFVLVQQVNLFLQKNISFNAENRSSFYCADSCWDN